MNSPSIALPPPLAASARDRDAIAALVAAGARKLVVLDDDPTGTQTVHNVAVLTEWSVPALVRELRDPSACFYILTNSRALAPAAAASLNREIAGRLRAAADEAGREYTIVSRSDSTLRGHFPGEIDALAEAAGGPWDGVILIPAFFEGGRVTAGNVHYVVEGDRWVPAGETEFARDATFGYRSSDLREWIEEKTGGRVPASAVESIPLETLRIAGPEAVRDALRGMPRGCHIVVNAADYRDLEVFVHGLLLAEAAGGRFLFRTAASFVRVRAAVEPRGFLASSEMRAGANAGGVVFVGSYVEKSTRQLERALTLPGVSGIELRVGELAGGAGAAEIDRVVAETNRVIAAGRTAIVFTSRGHRSALGVAGELGAGRAVSDALVAVMRGLASMPRFVVAKGGITSSDLAVHGLGVRRAMVMGQAAAGVPVWRLGPESRFPGLPYVIFPGNVGTPESLRSLLEELLR